MRITATQDSTDREIVTAAAAAAAAAGRAAAAAPPRAARGFVRVVEDRISLNGMETGEAAPARVLNVERYNSPQ